MPASISFVSFEKSIHASLRRIRQSISQPLGNLSNILAKICLSNSGKIRRNPKTEWRSILAGKLSYHKLPILVITSLHSNPPNACLGILDGLTDGCKLPQSRLMVVTLWKSKQQVETSHLLRLKAFGIMIYPWCSNWRTHSVQPYLYWKGRGKTPKTPINLTFGLLRSTQGNFFSTDKNTMIHAGWNVL